MVAQYTRNDTDIVFNTGEDTFEFNSVDTIITGITNSIRARFNKQTPFRSRPKVNILTLPDKRITYTVRTYFGHDPFDKLRQWMEDNTRFTISSEGLDTYVLTQVDGDYQNRLYRQFQTKSWIIGVQRDADDE